MVSFYSFAVLAVLLPFQTAMAANHFLGMGASNSVGGTGAYTCRTQAQWDTVARDTKALGMQELRITGFDCDALFRSSEAAAKYGLKVMAGIWVNGNIAQGLTQVNNDVQHFRAAYAKYGAGRYAGLTVGNEVQDSAINIMNKVWDVRGYLRSVGVTTPVSTVHTWVFVRDNPIMCDVDFAAVNAHAFFDPPTTSGTVGNFIRNTVLPNIRSKCPNKRIVITESGWPSRGGRVGNGVASVADETTALKELNCAAKDVALYLFEYDDQLWKGNDNERSFGAWGKIQGFIDSC